ncbi:MAG: glycosyltransferase family 4 protein [bacterium]
MKIAQIVSTFPPYQGGMGNVAYNFANELEKRNHQVTVFTPHQPCLAGRCRVPFSMDSTPAKKGDLKEVNFKTRHLTPFLKFGNAAFVPQLIWELSGFDIIHLHWPFFGGAEIVYLFKKAKKDKGKLVIQYHMDVVASGWKGSIFKIYNKILRAKILKTADLIICSSYDYINHSEVKENYQKNKDRWLEIPFGVDQEKFKPQSKKFELLTKYRIGSSDKIILFVGGLDKAHYFKGVEVLLEAFNFIIKDISDVKLLIVGEGDLKDKYQKLAAELKIGDKIIFAGGVANQDLPDYYNLADAVVLPSIDRSEAFGLVLLEAMACGKPVIASNLPGVRTLVEVGVNGFLCQPNNHNDLAEKLLKILSEKELANFFGQAGRKKVEEIYNWEKVGKKLEEAYLKII